MGRPGAPSPWSDLHRLEEDAIGLRERLRRVLVALVLTEEMLAETCRQLIDEGAGWSDRYTQQAERAELTAGELRGWLRRLEREP